MRKEREKFACTVAGGSTSTAHTTSRAPKSKFGIICLVCEAHIREEDGDDVLFKLLKKHGANFEAIDHGGNKPATLAAKAGRKKSKELLEEALVK